MKQFYKFIFMACLIMCFNHAHAQTENVLFNETFDTQDSMAKFQTLDVDGNEESWTYNTVVECARAMVPGFKAVNDWLITPAFDAKKGYTYRLEFSTEGNYGGILEVAHGNEPTDECLSGNILIEKTTLDGNAWQQMETEFVCDADGQHYFAFHSIGAEWLSTLDVDNIVITEIETAPVEPENTLYGTIAYSDDESATMGIYSFSPAEAIELTPVATRTDYIANGGGVYVDGKYYFMCYMLFGNTVSCFYNIYDMETGTTTSSIFEGRKYIATDMAYDPTTGNVYCCSVSNESGTPTYVLSTMDLETCAKAPIADIEAMMVIAIDKEGTLYGISNDGILYTIDKWSGETQEVGNTGVGNLNYLVQSGTIDPETDKFYWAAATADGSGLYEVNLETGEATLIGRFPNNEHMAGLFMQKDFFAATSPEAPSDFEVTFNGGELSGTASFLAPTLATDGSELAGTLTANVTVDGIPAAESIKVQPGESVEVPVTVTTEGFHTFTVFLSNESGNGRPVSTRIFVGYDTPLPVTDLTLESRGNGEMYVSWTAPTQGVNGGYIDTENLTYSIQRYPDYKWLTEEYTATEYTDILDSEYCETYSYGIVTTSHGKSSEMVVSNFVTVGDELQIPFLETFEVKPRFAAWSTIDANGDEVTWHYSYNDRAAYYEFSFEDANDWLISPKFTLEAGTDYELTIDARNSISGEPEKMEAFIGSAPDAESMTQEILPLVEIDDNSTYQTFTRTFSVPANGTFYLGVRVSSESHIGDLLVKNIGISISENSSIKSSGKATSKAWTEGGLLHIDNQENTMATVYSINGTPCGMVPAQETATLDLPAGFYIVSFEGKSIKVTVKK